MSNQDLKKISEIHINNERNKMCKNEEFLKKSLFHAAWFLQKVALNSLIEATVQNLRLLFLTATDLKSLLRYGNKLQQWKNCCWGTSYCQMR